MPCLALGIKGLMVVNSGQNDFLPKCRKRLSITITTIAKTCWGLILSQQQCYIAHFILKTHLDKGYYPNF